MLRRLRSYFREKISNEVYGIKAYLNEEGKIKIKESSHLVGMLLPSRIKDERIKAVTKELQDDIKSSFNIHFIKHVYVDGKIIATGYSRT